MNGVLRVDGRVAHDRTVSLSVDAALLTDGDALFETVRVDGGRAPRLSLHVDRLAEAAARAGLGSLDRAFVTAHLQRAVEDVQAPVGRVRGTFFVDEAGRPRCWTDAAAWDPPTDAAYRAGVGLRVVDVPHAPSGAWGKTASRQWARTATRLAAPDEPVVLAPCGAVVESARAAIVWRIDGRWCRPPASFGALASVTVRALEDAGCHFAEQRVDVRGLEAADAVVLLSSLRLAIGARRMGDREWASPDAAAAPLRSMLMGTGA